MTAQGDADLICHPRRPGTPSVWRRLASGVIRVATVEFGIDRGAAHDIVDYKTIEVAVDAKLVCPGVDDFTPLKLWSWISSPARSHRWKRAFGNRALSMCSELIW
jgi:hypothetical protein